MPITIVQQPSQGSAPATSAVGCFRPTQAGYPEGLTVPANFNPLTAASTTPRPTRTGNIQSWHVTVQRELGEPVRLDVAYVGNRSRKLIILGDYNQARPNATGQNVALQARRPIQGYQFIQAAFDGGEGDYHALQVKVERRYNRGLYLLNSFTWSKAIDNASGHLETANGDNSRVNIADVEGEFGLSGYNQPFNNTTTVVYELPFGRDRRWASDMPAVVEGILGGWRLTAINTMASGLPVNLTYSPSAAFNVSSAPTYRPNLSGDVYAPEGEQSITNWFNKANVTIPTDVTQPFGNAPRNVARGPALYVLDLGLHKGFGLVGRSRLEFRIEAFNVLNKTNFGAPNSNVSATNFGTITGLATPARQLQLGIKFDF